MKFAVAVLMLLTPALSFKMEVATTSSLTFDAEGAKNRPVSKVITLLKDMLKQLEKEEEEEEEIYDQMACWCETNDKEKTKSIADAEARISDLTTKIEELTANSARLNTEIKNLEKEVAENQNALDKATAIRQKQLAEFNEEEKDLLESISALKAAVTVLSKHNSLIQMPRSHLVGVAASVQNVMQRHASVFAGVLTHSERRAVSSFIQAPEDYFDER
jgi:chromosome segregation ATPase